MIHHRRARVACSPAQMSESASERKARLKALRAAAEASDAVPRRDAEDECAPTQPALPLCGRPRAGPRRAPRIAAPRPLRAPLRLPLPCAIFYFPCPLPAATAPQLTHPLRARLRLRPAPVKFRNYVPKDEQLQASKASPRPRHRPPPRPPHLRWLRRDCAACAPRCRTPPRVRPGRGSPHLLPPAPPPQPQPPGPGERHAPASPPGGTRLSSQYTGI